MTSPARAADSSPPPAGASPPVLQSRADLARFLRDELRCELRTCFVLDAPARPVLPPPHDLGAEREVLEALLCGRARVADLAPLGAADFHSSTHQVIFAACAALERAGRVANDRAPSFEAIAALLERQRLSGPELLDELHRLRDLVPAALRWREAVARILDAAKRRELCAAMARVDGALRVGISPAPNDLSRVRELVTEVGAWL